jgi:hypothetical protein
LFIGPASSFFLEPAVFGLLELVFFVFFLGGAGFTVFMADSWHRLGAQRGASPA